MRRWLIDELRCPQPRDGGLCSGKLALDPVQCRASTEANGDEIRDAVLICGTCGAHYPVIAGVAVLLRETYSWLRRNYYYVVSGAVRAGGMDPEINAWLERRGWHLSNHAADNYYETPRWINIFTDTHYGAGQAASERDMAGGRIAAAQPQVFEVMSEMISRHVRAPVDRALEIGANVGGLTRGIAAFAHRAYGIDVAYNPVLMARRIQCGSPGRVTSYERCVEGNSFEPRKLGPMPDNTEFLAASAYELPLRGKFGLILAANVIDSTANPRLLLERMQEALEPGGYLLVSSPYSWGSDEVDPDLWIGGAVDRPSKAAVPEVLRRSGLTVVEETDDVPWVLREHRRWHRVFSTHCILARKQ
jgi:SAM-dependent methyltransferase/uncharacterized protein YbaR (Trm112 family)